MAKTNKGVVDTKDFPRGKPTGVASAMQIAAPLETGIDISQSFGPDKPSPTRGSKTPTLSSQIPPTERKRRR